MNKIRLRIPGSLGAALGAELDLPEHGQPRAYALFAHCFTCSRNLKSFHIICDVLARAGIGVLRFDFTGIGDSDGDFSKTHFATDVDDIIAAAEYMSANYAAPQLLIGHSLGGTASLVAARRLPSVRAAVTIAAPADPGHVARYFIGKRVDVTRKGKAEIMVGGNHFTIGNDFFKDLAYAEDGSELRGFDKPLLICQSTDDEMLSFDHAQRLFAHTGQPASLLALDHADHLLKQRADAEYIANMITTWALRYIG
jgi:pimeloyl-ACP methyl ester carboxylesterase